MTEKLYDSDSYATEFDACVISCEPCETGYKTVLDKTLFFPEEGGQCCDRGTLSGVLTDHVSIVGDTIYHYTKSPFSVGDTVHGVIDFSVRFRNMQNHTGEHIICGVAHSLYGYENVGFHLGADYVTMDLSGPLTEEEIRYVEKLSNEAVFKNLSVKGFYPSEKELETIDYRSKSDISGKIRIVTIDGVDACACCAPHVKSTGEVGLIKILDAIHYKGGMRLNILCGFDALFDYEERFKINVALSNMLSTPQSDVVGAVERLLEENNALKQKISQKSRKIVDMYVDAVSHSQESIIVFEEDLDANMMRILANKIKEKTDKLSAVLTGNDETGYKYIITSSHVDLKSHLADMNTSLSGRGGGSSQMIQGSFESTRANIENYLKGIL